MLSFCLWLPLDEEEETEVTAGELVSMVNELTERVLLTLLALSVTLIVQLL